MVYMTTIFCWICYNPSSVRTSGKNYDLNQLWPKPSHPVRHGLSPATTTPASEVPYFEKRRHPGVPDSLDKQSHFCTSSNPTSICSISASTGHLSQSCFYMFFSLCWLWPTNIWVIRCCLVNRVCERRCTQALACANVASCELSVLFHHLNSFN